MNLNIWNHKTYQAPEPAAHANGVWSCCRTDHTHAAGLTEDQHAAYRALYPCATTWTETNAHPARTVLFGVANHDGKA